MFLYIDVRVVGGLVNISNIGNSEAVTHKVTQDQQVYVHTVFVEKIISNSEITSFRAVPRLIFASPMRLQCIL